MKLSAEPVWSILICTVWNRREGLKEVWEELDRQITTEGLGRQVELLALCDNKTRSVGYKRQALMDVARGRYLSYVDDDDMPMPEYVRAIYPNLLGNGPDLVVFPIKVTIDGKMEGIVEPSIQYVPTHYGDPLDEYQPPVTKRPPHMLCIWKAKIARLGTWTDESFRDDFAWSCQVWPYVKREVRVPQVLYWWKGRTNEEATVGM